MTFIEETFYKESYEGREIPASDFKRIAEVASETVYSICRVKPDTDTVETEEFKKAVCYQTELLYEQGGIDLITGVSAASSAVDSETLGDYSVSSGSSQKGVATVEGGIPVSPMALVILRRLGLMSRWAYSGFFEPWR